MKTLLATIEKHIADVETQYQEECFFNYGSRHADYLLGVLSGLYKVRAEVKERLEQIELDEICAKLDTTLTKMENELKGA